MYKVGTLEWWKEQDIHGFRGIHHALFEMVAQGRITPRKGVELLKELEGRTFAQELPLGPWEDFSWGEERPRIIVLCGSTRFTSEMMKEAWRLTLEGHIVIHWNILEAPVNFSHGAEALGEDVRKRIDDLYLRKIELGDEVRILNVGGYVGESTRQELAHARKTGKDVSWLEPDRIPEDLR